RVLAHGILAHGVLLHAVLGHRVLAHGIFAHGVLAHCVLAHRVLVLGKGGGRECEAKHHGGGGNSTGWTATEGHLPDPLETWCCNTGNGRRPLMIRSSRCNRYRRASVFLSARTRPPNIRVARMTIATATTWTVRSVAVAS